MSWAELHRKGENLAAEAQSTAQKAPGRALERVLAADLLPAFALDQMQGLLQAIWSEEVRQNAGFKFSEGALLISVSGGQSVTGGAPLDLVVSKVEDIQSIFFRTVEYLQKLPLRKRGPAPAGVQDVCALGFFRRHPGATGSQSPSRK